MPRHWLLPAGLGLVAACLTAGCGSDPASDPGSPAQPAAGGHSGALQIHYDYVVADDDVPAGLDSRSETDSASMSQRETTKTTRLRDLRGARPRLT